MATRSPNRQRLLLPLATLVVLGVVWVLAWPSGEDARPSLGPALDPSGSLEQGGLAPAPRAADLAQDAPAEQLAAAPERVELDALDRPSPLVAPGEGVLFEGRVVARQDGAPVEGAELQLVDEGWSLETASDGDGRFALEYPEGALPGLRVTKAGFGALYRPITGKERTLVLQLEPGATLAGRVIGPDASALGGGEARVFHLSSPERLRHTELSAPLDAEGTFTFEGLGAGEYVVQAQVPGWSVSFEHGLRLEAGETRRLSLEATRGATLTGRLAIVGGGGPVEGARLTVEPETPGLPRDVRARARHVVESDAEGRYRVVGLPPGPISVQVEAPWETRVRADLVVFEAGQELERDFELQAPGVLEGRVLQAAGGGGGVAGAVVEVAWSGPAISPRLDRRGRVGRGHLRTTCDAEGRFRLEGLPGGRSLEVVAYSGEAGRPALAADSLSEPRTLRLRSAEERVGLELIVRETAARRGVVRDSFGAPIAGAELRLIRGQRGGRRRSSVPRGTDRLQAVTSDADGAFELVGLLPGSYQLACKHDEYLSAYHAFRVQAEGGEEVVEVELRRAERLFGWVVDEQGQAISRAKVEARPFRLDGLAEVPKKEKGARTDAFGRFEFPQLWPGTWSLSAKATGYQRLGTPVTAITHGEVPLLLTLRRDGSEGRTNVTGRVTNREGEPLVGIGLDSLRGGALEVSEGRFRLSGARSGDTRLRVSAPGYLAHRTERLRLVPGQELDLGTLELDPAGALEVLARTEHGQPVLKFKAVLEPVKGSARRKQKGRVALELVQARHRYKGSAKRVSTRAAVHERVPLRSWRLRVSARGYAPHEQLVRLSQEKPSRRLEVVLSLPQAEGQ